METETTRRTPAETGKAGRDIYDLHLSEFEMAVWDNESTEAIASLLRLGDLCKLFDEDYYNELITDDYSWAEERNITIVAYRIIDYLDGEMGEEARTRFYDLDRRTKGSTNYRQIAKNWIILLQLAKDM